jgi:hypothetical protein
MKFALTIFASATLLALAATAAPAQAAQVMVSGGIGTTNVVNDQGTISSIGRVAFSSCFKLEDANVTPVTKSPWSPINRVTNVYFDYRLVHNMAANPATCGDSAVFATIQGSRYIGNVRLGEIQVNLKAPRFERQEVDANATYLNLSALQTLQVGDKLLSVKTGGAGGKPSLFNTGKWNSHKTVQVMGFGSSKVTVVRSVDGLKDVIGRLNSYDSVAFAFLATQADPTDIQIGSNGGPLWFVKVVTKPTPKIPSVVQMWTINPNSGDLVFSRVY